MLTLCLLAILTTFSDSITYVEKYLNLPPVDFSLADAVKTDVKYRLFVREDDNVGLVLDDESVKNTTLNLTLPTKLFIHGWTTNEHSPWYQPLKKEYFLKGPHNIFYIDWSKAGGKEYPVSAANVNPIGEYIADFLIASKISLKNIHIIGHSLGSHLAGFIGKHVHKKTGKKIERITAPDPGGPMFEHKNMTKHKRLDASDAHFVDVIHTDIGHYGFIAPIGDVDYYVNGGKDQPGCPPLEIDDNCSHARSLAYFIESVNSHDFIAKQCKSWKDYVAGKCKTNKEVVFGDNVQKKSRGVYYFATNAQPPYAIKGN